MAHIKRSDRYYIPEKYVDMSQLHNMELTIVDGVLCKDCRHIDESDYEDFCDSCKMISHRFIFHDGVRIKGKQYVSMLPGDIESIRKTVPDFDNLKIRDKRIEVGMRSQLKYILPETREYRFQSRAVTKLAEYDEGLLVSPPRSGKTGMVARLTCLKKQRTLILAHQDDLLLQFRDTFCGNKKKNIPAFTNASALEKKKGYPVIKVQEKHEDFFDRRYDVVLSNYQVFIRNPRLLKKVGKEFGMIVVDEVHRQAADCYSRTVSGFHSKFRYGVSGTDKRKDSRHLLTGYVSGPVRYRVKIKSLIPEVLIRYSKLNRKISNKQWTYMIKNLYSNGPRNDDIVNHIIKDIKRGESIVVPCVHRNYIDTLVEEINRKWMDYTGDVKPVASAFYSGSKKWKTSVLEKAINGDIKCVVAMRSMLLGINIPRWSMIYEVSPISNAPSFEQESKRVCTPFQDKKPKIKFFVDEKCSVSVSCFLNTIQHCRNLGYHISKKEWKKIQTIRVNHADNRFRSKTGEERGIAGIGKPGKIIEL